MRRRGGLGLVEILLALTVLGLAMLPIFGTFTSGTLAAHQIVHTTRALHLAAEQLELVRGLPFGEIAALPPSRLLDSSQLGKPFEGELERTDEIPDELVRVTVRIRWKVSPKLTEKLELASFFLNPQAR